MKKPTKIGWSAMVAFALMFATTVSGVAQENVVASDNVEARESVEAMVLGATALQLNMEFAKLAQEKANISAAANALAKEPVVGDVKTEKSVATVVHKKLAPTYAWYDLDPTTNTNQSNQFLQTGSTGSPPPASGVGCTQENVSGDFCKVLIKSASGRTSWPSLPPGTSVSALIASDSADLSLGDDNIAEDQNTDGYSMTLP